VIRFDDSRREPLHAYLDSGEARDYSDALELTSDLIDGFESPFGLELLATVDWLLSRENTAPEVSALRAGLLTWPVADAGQRKSRVFDDRALAHLTGSRLYRISSGA
jgi:hypothetical protein